MKVLNVILVAHWMSIYRGKPMLRWSLGSFQKLNRLKYIYPLHVLLTIYKSLFVPHINYGSLVCGQNFNSFSKLQKKVIRTVTRSNYIAHSEPLLKGLNLLSVKI